MYKENEQTVEITTIILNQNKNDLINLPEFLMKNLNINSLIIQSFLFVPEKYNLFKDILVKYEEIKTIILELSKQNNFKFHFKYIPVCIFSDSELNRFKENNNFNFFNSYYLYNLNKNTDGSTIDYVKKYRNQEYHEKCSECYLKHENLCNGIMTSYLILNKNYKYNPISKTLFDNIKNIITSLKIN